MGFQTVKNDGHQYEAHAHACVNMPDIADKVKEGLGQSKVCFRAVGGAVILPKDYDESRL